MLIECHNCKARVDAEVIGRVDEPSFIETRTFLLKCPACKSALVGFTEEDFRDDKVFWPDLVRVYPRTRRLLGSSIPPLARQSIDEAERCMQAGAYLAAAAMCGRALEAVCRHFGTKDTYLGQGIKELKDKGVIDLRLYQWSEELKDARNNAAHATDAVLTAQDAEDLLSLAYAIIDYVFLLALKFDRFKERKAKRAADAKGKNKSPPAASEA